MKVKVSSTQTPSKEQRNLYLSSIEELMESISEVGLLQPLIIDHHAIRLLVEIEDLNLLKDWDGKKLRLRLKKLKKRKKNYS